MREEVKRINKMVAEGKISPDDAADLIDAFYASEREEAEAEPSEPTPPPQHGTTKDPLKGIVDQIEKLTKEGIEAVDWKEVSEQARNSARKGLDFLKTGIEDLSKGKVKVNLFGYTESKEVLLPLNVGEGKTLKIENACGDVRVTGGRETGNAVARAKFRGTSLEEVKARAQEYTLIIEESDYHVIIRQPDVPGLTVDLDVQVVGSAPVEIKTETGDLFVTDTMSNCRVSATSGDIHLHGLNGTIEINSQSGHIRVEDSDSSNLLIENKAGDIRVDRVKGNMNVRTSSGDVHVGAATGKIVALESISGDVSVDLLEPVVGSVSVRTVNGDAFLGVPDGSDCRVTLATLRGSVDCAITLTDEVKSDQRITGKLGQGTGSLDVSAVTGNVTLALRKTESATV